MRRRPHLVPVAETNLVSRSIGERRRGAALTRERPWHKSVSRPTVVWTPSEFRLAESSGAHTCQLRHAGSAPAPVGRCSSARWNGAYSARNANAASLRRTPQSSRHWRSRQERRGVVKAHDRGQRRSGAATPAPSESSNPDSLEFIREPHPPYERLRSGCSHTGTSLAGFAL
jgi:hypothetical protein